MECKAPFKTTHVKKKHLHISGNGEMFLNRHIYHTVL